MSWIQTTTPVLRHVKLIRGDSAQIAFTSPWADADVAEARLMARDADGEGDIVLALTKTADAGRWTIAAGASTVDLQPGDTDGKAAGLWWYDVELQHTAGTVATVLYGRFNLVADQASDVAGGALAGLLEAQLIAWTHATAFAFTVPVYDATWPDTVASSAVVWPDGSGGTFTATSINPYCGLVDAFTVTHTDSGKTVTQAAVTRDADNRITAQPAPTVS